MHPNAKRSMVVCYRITSSLLFVNNTEILHVKSKTDTLHTLEDEIILNPSQHNKKNQKLLLKHF